MILLNDVRRLKRLLISSLFVYFAWVFVPKSQESLRFFEEPTLQDILYCCSDLLLIVLIVAVSWKLACSLKIGYKMGVLLICGYFVPLLCAMNAFYLVYLARKTLRQSGDLSGRAISL